MNNGSLADDRLVMGGRSLVNRQDWIIGKKYHGGALGWEIWSKFCGILPLFWFQTFSPPEFSSEFHYSNHKICSRQIGTCSHCFGILSCHLFFHFHASEKKSRHFFILPTKITSTCFPSKTSRCHFGGKRYCKCFLWNPIWCKCANYATTLWLRL